MLVLWIDPSVMGVDIDHFGGHWFRALEVKARPLTMKRNKLEDQ